MYQPQMALGAQERAMLDGEKGDTLRKVIESVVRYGETFGASRLIPLDGPVHLVTSFGIPILTPVFEMMDELIAAKLVTQKPFTVNPRPLDYRNIKCNPLEKVVFHVMYGRQKSYENQLRAVGLKDDDAFSCTCYLDEVGNKPRKGDILAWAESSAVVYANSVLGARTNRNSGIIELFCGILGKTPEFGFLTDEGRRADWVIEVKSPSLPNPQLLGSAIGMKVMADVPYIRGLEQFFPEGLDDTAKAYFKDMGAAAASNGAVGLFHVQGLTPEAAELGDSLVKAHAQTYIIDDDELERVQKSYAVMWSDPSAKPELAFIGCPHLTIGQLCAWTERIEKALTASGRRKLGVRAILCAAPGVVKEFKTKGDYYKRLSLTGAHLTSICPLMYMNSPICAKKPVITCSNKLRTYTTARFYEDERLLSLIVKGE
ncbi:MAG: aconitase X [Clostridia bacterium]|nr:aconitase X [Clostridia bacterium]